MLRIRLKVWIVAAVLAVAAFCASGALAPSAWAHGALQNATPDAAAPAAAHDGAQYLHVFAAPAHDGAAQSCPGDRDSRHAGYPGCCAAAGHCATGCGAAIVAAVAAIPLSHRHVGPGIEPPPALGIVTELTDPPPRSSI